jgi:hypothetical protein
MACKRSTVRSRSSPPPPSLLGSMDSMPQPLKRAPSGIQYRPKILAEERPQHLAGIGLVAAEWAGLENHLIEVTAFCLYALTNPEAHSAVKTALYAVESQRARLDIIKNLLENRGVSELYEYFKEELKPEIEKRAGERNKVVHGHWGIIKEFPDKVILISDDNEHQSYSVKDFEDIVERIIQTSNNIATFMHKLKTS